MSIADELYFLHIQSEEKLDERVKGWQKYFDWLTEVRLSAYDDRGKSIIPKTPANKKRKRKSDKDVKDKEDRAALPEDNADIKELQNEGSESDFFIAPKDKSDNLRIENSDIKKVGRPERSTKNKKKLTDHHDDAEIDNGKIQSPTVVITNKTVVDENQENCDTKKQTVHGRSTRTKNRNAEVLQDVDVDKMSNAEITNNMSGDEITEVDSFKIPVLQEIVAKTKELKYNDCIGKAEIQTQEKATRSTRTKKRIIEEHLEEPSLNSVKKKKAEEQTVSNDKDNHDSITSYMDNNNVCKDEFVQPDAKLPRSVTEHISKSAEGKGEETSRVTRSKVRPAKRRSIENQASILSCSNSENEEMASDAPFVSVSSSLSITAVNDTSKVNEFHGDHPTRVTRSKIRKPQATKSPKNLEVKTMSPVRKMEPAIVGSPRIYKISSNYIKATENHFDAVSKENSAPILVSSEYPQRLTRSKARKPPTNKSSPKKDLEGKKPFSPLKIGQEVAGIPVIHKKMNHSNKATIVLSRVQELPYENICATSSPGKVVRHALKDSNILSSQEKSLSTKPRTALLTPSKGTLSAIKEKSLTTKSRTALLTPSKGTLSAIKIFGSKGLNTSGSFLSSYSRKRGIFSPYHQVGSSGLVTIPTETNKSRNIVTGSSFLVAPMAPSKEELDEVKKNEMLKRREKEEETRKKKEEIMRLRTEEQKRKNDERMRKVQETREARERKVLEARDIQENDRKMREEKLKMKRNEELKNQLLKKQIEQKNREEQKLQEKKMKEEQKLKEKKFKEEQRLKENQLREEQILKEIKIKEDQRLKEEKHREEMKSQEQQRIKAEKKALEMKKIEENRKKMEEQRRIFEQRKEMERIAQEKEAARIAREKRELEELQLKDAQRRAAYKKGLGATPSETESAALNSTYTKPREDEEETASYDMTPVVIKIPNGNPDDYGIDDFESGDSTDDETAPKKKIPLWAKAGQLKKTLFDQSFYPPDVDAIFSVEALFKPIDLNKIFPKRRSRFMKRTSSALWDTPPHKLFG